MGNKKVVPIWISVLLLIILAVSVVLDIRAVVTSPEPDAGAIAACVVFCLACLFAAYYCFKGYKKNAAIYFKLFCATKAIYHIITIAYYVSFSLLGISVVCHAISLGIAVAFLFSSNMGKQKSYILGIVNVLASVVPYIYCLANGIISTNLMYIIVLSIVFMIMIFAKYRDKDARGTN